jgi:holo-[acyl-carrier protein] synthase
MEIIGNGVDITEVRRIKSAVDKYGKNFLDRIFTAKELKRANEHNSFYQHLAGRFAAKEAVFKAFGRAKLSFKDVEVINNSEGKPYCSLLTHSKNKPGPCVQGRGKFNIHISISHIKNYAVASAIITQETSGP